MAFDGSHVDPSKPCAGICGIYHRVRHLIGTINASYVSTYSTSSPRTQVEFAPVRERAQEVSHSIACLIACQCAYVARACRVEHRQRTTDSAGPESTIDSQLFMARVPWPSSEKKKAQSTSDSRLVTVSRRVQRWILWLPGYEAILTLVQYLAMGIHIVMAPPLSPRSYPSAHSNGVNRAARADVNVLLLST